MSDCTRCGDSDNTYSALIDWPMGMEPDGYSEDEQFSRLCEGCASAVLSFIHGPDPDADE